MPSGQASKIPAMFYLYVMLILVHTCSDIDVLIQTPQIYEDAYKIRALFQLQSMLRSTQLTRNGQVSSGAKVPILSFSSVPAFGEY